LELDRELRDDVPDCIRTKTDDALVLIMRTAVIFLNDGKLKTLTSRYIMHAKLGCIFEGEGFLFIL